MSETATTRAVRFERHGDVGIVTIDNPPINAGSKLVRKGLLEAISDIDADPELVGGVIVGAGSNFMAGSDIKEFDLPLDEPQLPTVIAALGASGKPFVAAIAGAALGGGYELALGCDYRVASPDAVVGLPETTLGIIPGAGGTQRLPRLVGRVKAIELICGGTRVPAATALALGMVDEVAERKGLLEAAVRMAAKGPGSKRDLMEEAVAEASDADLEKARGEALKRGRNRPHIAAAIDAIDYAGTMPAADALGRERATFQVLRTAPEATALRHLFFAERAAGKMPELAGAAALDVTQLGIVGGGTMGSGIAVAFLDAGKSVTIFEVNADAAAGAMARVRKNYEDRHDRGRVSTEEMERRLGRFATEIGLDGIVRMDAVIEAVFEDLAVKQDLFGRLGRIAKPDALLFTNTSYLSVGEIARGTDRPARVGGLHFFSPADVMRLVEVVRHDGIAPETLATAVALAKGAGKMPVVVGDAFGFIGNRVYAAYRRQVEFLLEEGALPQQVDAALEAFGFAMGPFAVADMSGLDIAWRMRQATAATRDPSARYVEIPDRLCEMGRLGRKSGAGYYSYPEGARKGVTDPIVEKVVVAASAKAGRVRRTIGDGEIVERVLASMANEAALLIEEGVTTRPSDVDLVLVNGYGFPRHEGGPVFWARQQPPSALAAAFERLREVGGPTYRLGKREALLDS